MAQHRILVVDDDVNMRAMLTTALARIPGYSVREAENGDQALDMLRDDEVDVVLSDMNMPKMSGMELLKRLREFNTAVPFIIITAYGTIESAVGAMRLGATDYLEKGDAGMLKALEVKVAKCLEIKALHDENRALRAELDRRYQYVGRSRTMEEVNKLVATVAKSSSTVLITGESGTGKELVARAIHIHSRRSHSTFVKFNCAAMPDTLIESELFGHEKGSFTGALRKTRGKFELAHGGTLLMDEIGEMPLSTQAKLLRVLQEKEIDKIGAEAPVPVDVRIVATTNRNLKKEVEAGKFREDLFFRLNVIPIELPALRDRREDIPLLADHFIKKLNEENGLAVAGLEPAALELLQKYDWPGNIRELENALERAVVVTRSGKLGAGSFALAGALRREGPEGLSPGATIADMERKLIYKTLEHCRDNKTKAADMLGISIRTLRNKLNEYEGRGAEAEPVREEA